MPYPQMLSVLAMVSLALPGFVDQLAAQSNGSIWWLGVLIALLLLLLLVWWLRRSTKETTPAATRESAVTPHVPEGSMPETAPPQTSPAPEIMPAEAPSAAQVSVEPETPVRQSLAEAVVVPAAPEVPVEAESAGPPDGSAVAPEPVIVQAAGEIPVPDDLTIIEGIGPKIAGILQTAGITTLAQLANADIDQLRQILQTAGLTRLANPETWPEQAHLAAAGDWDAFKKLQGELRGGRRVP